VELNLRSPVRLHGVVLGYKNRDNFTFTLERITFYRGAWLLGNDSSMSKI